MKQFTEKQIEDILEAVLDATFKSMDKRIDIDSSDPLISLGDNKWEVTFSKSDDVKRFGCKRGPCDRKTLGEQKLKLTIIATQEYIPWDE